jgi:hypothetical protein
MQYLNDLSEIGIEKRLERGSNLVFVGMTFRRRTRNRINILAIGCLETFYSQSYSLISARFSVSKVPIYILESLHIYMGIG